MQTTNTVRREPLLIYDGDCRFCIFWASYWQRLTGPRVTYAPYQEVAAQYPEIPLAAFQRAVQYVAPDGKIASGAEASLLTLSHASGKGFWLMLYRHLPGFAAIAELVYASVASHRYALDRPSLWLWSNAPTSLRQAVLDYTDSPARSVKSPRLRGFRAIGRTLES